MRILVSGGGTAGHISPVLAIIEELKSQRTNSTILYVGQNNSLEAEIARSAGVDFRSITAGKFRRFYNRKTIEKIIDLKTNSQNLIDSFRVIKGLKQSLDIIRQFKPDVIFVKGGYVGLPVGLAARLKRIPYIIHESDTIPGLTNRLLAKGAKKIAVGFETKNYQKYFPLSRTIFTGNPIRTDLLRYTKPEGIARFRLDTNFSTILITGGSQGAHLINETTLDVLFEINKKYQIIHLVGKNNIDEIRSTVKKMQLTYPQRYKSFAFLTKDVGLAFAAADLVVSRAGANTISELAALNKPTILIPNALLAGGHQIKNALVLSRQGAARVITEDRLNAQTFLTEINKILSSPEEQEQLAHSISKFAALNASKDIVKLILEAGNVEGDE